jgi:hypothetical protein
MLSRSRVKFWGLKRSIERVRIPGCISEGKFSTVLAIHRFIGPFFIHLFAFS